MKIKYIFFIIFLGFFIKENLAAKNFNIIASVNNHIITEIDLNNELKIIKFLNSKDISSENLTKIAITNLIDEKIKLIEIKSHNIEYIDKEINKYYEIFLINSNLKEKKIEDVLKNLIKEKIFIDRSWNNLINQKYAWKINININEINNKIDDKSNNLKEEDIFKIKDNLISDEKNKKIKVFAKYHFNKIKKDTLIKFY